MLTASIFGCGAVTQLCNRRQEFFLLWKFSNVHKKNTEAGRLSRSCVEAGTEPWV